MILEVLGLYCEHQNYTEYSYLAGINPCMKLLPETVKQFNLSVNRALPVSHVVIFTLQGHYN
jgi:hypothetical protein